MINDAELYELEILLIDKFEKFDFGKVPIDSENKKILIESKDLQELVLMHFKDRHEIIDKKSVISFDLFKLLQSRYFRNNNTLSFVEL